MSLKYPELSVAAQAGEGYTKKEADNALEIHNSGR